MRKRILFLMLCAIALASVAQQPPISHLEINNVRPTILGDGSCFLPGWDGFISEDQANSCPT